MRHIAQILAAQGRHGDDALLHVSHRELAGIQALGQASGRPLTTNPTTGLPEAFSWSGLRDAIETGGAVALNYYLPGSGMVTSQMTSKGSQKQLDSGLGRAAMLASGIGGASGGNLGHWTGDNMGSFTAANAAPAAAGAATSTTPVASTPAASTATPDTLGAPAASTANPDTLGDPASSGGTPLPAQQSPSAWSRASDMGSSALKTMEAHPYLTTIGGLAAMNAYTAAHQQNTNPTHPVYMAGKSHSGITANSPQSYSSGPGERTYFANNAYGNYTQDPGYYAMRPGYAAGGLASLQAHQKAFNPLYIKGQGDGMSDSVPATIDGNGVKPNEHIRVANNEYVIPADVVSHLGNGSSDAGAKKLDKMVAGIRTARTGRSKQAPQINADRFLLKAK